MDAQPGNSVLEEVPFSLPIKIENTHETEQKKYLFVTLSKTSDDGQTVFKQNIDGQTGNSFLEEDPLSLLVKKENMHETEQKDYLFVPLAKTDDEPTIFKHL
ncbi:uncharacterized protein LOC142333427 [Lycorma delicatula]|uniref:uncharacterized protein LOC142333427 n=1 Tax=Lycorma delicatula TaxID=130591 RepID=UPI003F51AACE